MVPLRCPPFFAQDPRHSKVHSLAALGMVPLRCPLYAQDPRHSKVRKHFFFDLFFHSTTNCVYVQISPWDPPVPSLPTSPRAGRNVLVGDTPPVFTIASRPNPVDPKNPFGVSRRYGTDTGGTWVASTCTPPLPKKYPFFKQNIKRVFFSAIAHHYAHMRPPSCL